VAGDILKDRLVGGFAAKELAHHILDIHVAGTGTHLHECSLIDSVGFHDSLHFLFVVLTPDALQEEFFLHSFLFLVFAFILSLFADALLI